MFLCVLILLNVYELQRYNIQHISYNEATFTSLINPNYTFKYT